MGGTALSRECGDNSSDGDGGVKSSRNLFRLKSGGNQLRGVLPSEIRNSASFPFKLDSPNDYVLVISFTSFIMLSLTATIFGLLSASDLVKLYLTLIGSAFIISLEKTLG